jgi:hypothetical protein
MARAMGSEKPYLFGREISRAGKFLPRKLKIRKIFGLKFFRPYFFFGLKFEKPEIFPAECPDCQIFLDETPKCRKISGTTRISYRKKPV